MKSLTNTILFTACAVIANDAAAMKVLFNINGESEQATIARSITNQGGQLIDCIEQINICQADFPTWQQAQTANIQAIPDMTTFIQEPNEAAKDETYLVREEHVEHAALLRDNDFFFDLQWGHTAVGATSAWDKGHRGQGTRIAVLDSGAFAYHRDLYTNINHALSRSFVLIDDVLEPWNETFNNYFHHGSHVAGIIAAADNSFGIIGVAPEAELMILKVLSARTGIGSSFNTMAALVYAADNGADIANLSLSNAWRKNGYVDIEGTPYDTSDDIRVDVDELNIFKNMYSKAIQYARSKGMSVIAAAGNQGINSNFTDSFISVPADLPGVISVSATTPMLWAKDVENTYLDNRATYSNHGQSSIHLAAPGGDFSSMHLPGGTDFCNVGILFGQYCFVFDAIFSTGGSGAWYWSSGTSMATPYATGVAALILSAHTDDMSPAELEQALRTHADDLGRPGKDAYYGHGRVHAPKQ